MQVTPIVVLLYDTMIILVNNNNNNFKNIIIIKRVVGMSQSSAHLPTHTYSVPTCETGPAAKLTVSCQKDKYADLDDHYKYASGIPSSLTRQ